MTTTEKGHECPITIIDEAALQRAIKKARELADAGPKKYRRVK